MGAVGLGLSLASMPAFVMDDEDPILVCPRFARLTPETALGEIRSNTVGQVVVLHYTYNHIMQLW